MFPRDLHYRPPSRYADHNESPQISKPSDKEQALTDDPESIFLHNRYAMVDEQIRKRGITAPGVLQAMRRVPRHLFLPPEYRDQAYEDHPVRIACGQTISQPYMVAVMTDLLDLAPNDRVLEIGTGSGYQTAILAELVQNVVSIERFPALADDARQRLDAMGYDHVQVICADGSLGCPEEAPFDAILVTAGSPSVPIALTHQLADAGRLVCPVGTKELQTLEKVRRSGDRFLTEHSTQCIFVPLIGRQGWKEEF